VGLLGSVLTVHHSLSLAEAAFMAITIALLMRAPQAAQT